MKKFVILFVLILCGCSNKSVLICSYIDNSSILGSKKISDSIYFKSDKIVSFKRNIVFSVNNGSRDVKNVYKIIKLEGKALKKYIGGKYKINKNFNEVNLVFNSKKFDNLKYIGIDTSYGYEDVLSVYSELGFSCK